MRNPNLTQPHLIQRIPPASIPELVLLLLIAVLVPLIGTQKVLTVGSPEESVLLSGILQSKRRLLILKHTLIGVGLIGIRCREAIRPAAEAVGTGQAATAATQAAQARRRSGRRSTGLCVRCGSKRQCETRQDGDAVKLVSLFHDSSPDVRVARAERTVSMLSPSAQNARATWLHKNRLLSRPTAHVVRSSAFRRLSRTRLKPELQTKVRCRTR